MATITPAIIREQLKTRFEALLDDKLVEDCVVLCQNYNISGDDLYFKWEAMEFKVPSSLRVFNADTIVALKGHIDRTSSQQNAKKLSTKSNTSGLLSKNLNSRALPAGRFLKSGNRPAASAPVRTLDLRRGGAASAGPSKVRFVAHGMDEASRKERRYRYMYEKVSERSGALDDRIDDIAELVQKHYGVPDLGDPSAETEEEVTVVGRITMDADSSVGGAKLNEASLTLETSRAMGSGKRVPLKFDTNIRVRGARKGVQGAGFFPGAIVALRGRNGGGKWFLVTEILSLPPLPPHEAAPKSADRAFSMCIVSGPFTADSDLNFDAWMALLKKIRSTRPSVILLIGPFIDSTHPLIKDGEIDKTPATLFREIFLDSLSEALDDLPGSIALVIPSIRDILSRHTVYPQSELELEFDHDPRIVMLPNPSRFTINDMSFAVCSVDVLFHLRKEEFFKRASEISPIGDEPQPSDAMANLCRHVLQQRSFYPIFPVPLDATHDVNLDISHSETLNLCEKEETAPDILILPSKLKQFVKHVDGTAVINPSFAVKGTFARLDFDGLQTEANIGIDRATPII